MDTTSWGFGSGEKGMEKEMDSTESVEDFHGSCYRDPQPSALDPKPFLTSTSTKRGGSPPSARPCACPHFATLPP